MAEAVTQVIANTLVLERIPEQPFYIPMTGPAARLRRSLKHDDTFIVLDSHGDIGASAGGPDGLFHADTRYLARLQLVFEDTQPLLLGSNLRDDNSSLTVDLTNPDVYRQGRLVLEKDMLHIVRTVFLWRGTAYQRVGLQNHGDRRASFDVTLLFDNDFADLFEVRGEKRQRIAIARAFLKDAPILLLDEATAALDGESEELIREALARLMRGRTVIAIAHRLSTLRNFDRVVVLKAGRIIEDGPPDRLMQGQGPYRELVTQEMSRLAKFAA